MVDESAIRAKYKERTEERDRIKESMREQGKKVRQLGRDLKAMESAARQLEISLE
jgi:hypothetical protein